jgi:hypothetical protein
MDVQFTNRKPMKLVDVPIGGCFIIDPAGEGSDASYVWMRTQTMETEHTGGVLLVMTVALQTGALCRRKQDLMVFPVTAMVVVERVP